MRLLVSLVIASVPTRMELQYPECSLNTLFCYRYEAEREYGPFDYIGALQRGLDRNAPNRKED